MADAATAKAPAPKVSKPMPAWKRYYLIFYNAVSALLWSVVWGRVVGVYALRGLGAYTLVPSVTLEFTKWTQTLAAMEILHSLLGIVRAPLFTTAMQVGSRFGIVWVATYFYPTVAYSPWYSSMLLAWSTTEVVRYLFFALTLADYQPYPIFWMRYSGFYILYPIGISSELAMMYFAFLKAREHGDDLIAIGLVAIAVAYIPGSPILYNHMRKQRKKVMRSQKTE